MSGERSGGDSGCGARERHSRPLHLGVSYAHPLSKGATGQENGARRGAYCLSYTATLVTFLPAASVMSVVSVRVL
jgi:hypothetical protein